MARKKKPGVDPEGMYEVEFDRRITLDLGKGILKTFYPGRIVWLKGKWLLTLLPTEGVKTWREN